MSIVKTNNKLRKNIQIIKNAIKNPTEKHTLADICLKTGLSIKDAERCTLSLVSKYKGELSVTDKGKMLFFFPSGFKEPWVSRFSIMEKYSLGQLSEDH